MHSGLQWKVMTLTSAFLLALLITNSAMAEDKIIKVAADRWCPINCTPMEDPEGIGIDLMRKIFEPQGYVVDYLLMPWDKALEKVKSGEIDAVVGAVPSEGPELLFPNQSIVEVTDDFFVKADDAWKFDDMASLKDMKLGVIKDYGYDDAVLTYIAQHGNNPTKVLEEEGGDALEKLIHNLIHHKVDVIVESRPVMHYMLRRLGVKEKVRWAGGLEAEPVFVAFSPAKKEAKKYVKLFDEGMRKLKARRSLTAMYEKYGLSLPQ